jgi:hypothetical protein
MMILLAISLIVIRGTLTIPFVSTFVTLFTPFFTPLLSFLAFLAFLLTFTLVMFVVLMTSFTPILTLVLSVSCHGYLPANTHDCRSDNLFLDMHKPT